MFFSFAFLSSAISLKRRFAAQIPVPDDDEDRFVYDLQRQHVVFCGTELLQGKAQHGNYIKAVVIRTGITLMSNSKYLLRQNCRDFV